MKLEYLGVDQKDSYQKRYRVCKGDYTLCHVVTAVGHCCGINSIEKVNSTFEYEPNLWKEVLDFLSSTDWRHDAGLGGYHERPSWVLKDFLYFAHSSTNVPDCDGRIQKIHTYPSRSEPGHSITIWKITL